jgi:hypothetical protein
MHGHVDATVGYIEEQVCLNYLEALVHEGGRVGRDDQAHVPGRMREGLYRGHVGQRRATAPSERTAGRGEHQAFDLFGSSGAQSLGYRGVLGVDGNDLSGAGELREQVAPDDQALLVGEGENPARLQRSDARAESDGARDAVENDVGVDVAHQLRRLIGPQRGVGDTELRGLCVEEFTIAARSEADHLEPLGIRANDFERLDADGAG